MSHVYQNLYRFIKKIISLLSFIFSIFFVSCNDHFDRIKTHKSNSIKGFKFSSDPKDGDRHKKTQDFLSKVNKDLIKPYEVSAFLPSTIVSIEREICYDPHSTDVKDVFLFCLVPGFKIQQIDPYSIEIARYLCNVLRVQYCLVPIHIVYKIFTRWGGGSRSDNIDNETFETQYFMLANQLNFQIKALRTRYPASETKIHVIFIGESFGGKISLYFLDQYLENQTHTNISFDAFISIHSPLYPMKLVQTIQRSILAHQISRLSSHFPDLDFLNNTRYQQTMLLLSQDEINYTNTDSVLENLKSKGIKFIHFIGTPDIVELDIGKFNRNNFLSTCKSILAGSDLVKNSLNLLGRAFLGLDPDRYRVEIDPLVKFFDDPSYTECSDLVVRICETTKKCFKFNTSEATYIYADDERIITSPNLIHLGKNCLVSKFREDLYKNDFFKHAFLASTGI